MKNNRLDLEQATDFVMVVEDLQQSGHSWIEIGEKLSSRGNTIDKNIARGRYNRAKDALIRDAKEKLNGRL